MQNSSLPDASVLAQQQPQVALPLPVRPPQHSPLHHCHAEERTRRAVVHGGQGLWPVSQPQLHSCYGALGFTFQREITVTYLFIVFTKPAGSHVKTMSDLAPCDLGGEGLAFRPEHSSSSDRRLRYLDLLDCAHGSSCHEFW